MRYYTLGFVALAVSCALTATGGEKRVVSLRDFCGSEVKGTGLEITQKTAVHIKATGGGGDRGWSFKSDRLFSYGWIINADTRELVWKMSTRNTSRSRDEREFDGTVNLAPGSYEVYFTVYGFNYHTTFSNVILNIDRRKHPLFGESSEKRGFFSWFGDWFSEGVKEEWENRCKEWGIDLYADESIAGQIKEFEPPKKTGAEVFCAQKVGDNTHIRRGFSLSAPTTVTIYALGERGSSGYFVDNSWINRVSGGGKVWEMSEAAEHAGGADKNRKVRDEVRLDAGEYVLTYVTDGSHSMEDWNDAPPDDPYAWGVCVLIDDPKEQKNFKETDVQEFRNTIVELVRVGDNEYQSAGFVLKKDADVRVYAIGERSNTKGEMADYGTILDARTRERVWSMGVENSSHAGGASKNRVSDEIIHLPRGSYLVTYRTDDSHAYGDWNSDPPYDQERYGITVMGSGEEFSKSIVGKYTEERDRNVIAEILQPGDDADLTKTFTLDRATRLRVYAIGEGQNREMYDYGWIEDAKTGTAVWEMTYSMTFHAGGARKNRMVNTTIILEKGSYRLRWVSDDSHAFKTWNMDPPEDAQHWGISLFRDERPLPPEAPEATQPIPPVPPPPKAPKPKAKPGG